jgi:DNA polymerase-1
MAEAFKAGLDPHEETAKLLMGHLGVEYDVVTDVLRQTYGKTPNFAIVYAGGWPTIQRQMIKSGLKCDKRMAITIFGAIKETMPEVKMLESAIHERLDEVGYVKTLWGRHLRPDLDKFDRRGAYRKMLNALIQGCAADLMRHALRETAKGLSENGCSSHLVNNVHDEIQIDAVSDEIPFLAEKVPGWMDYTEISVVVPVLADMEISEGSWADKQPYKV